MEGRKSDVAPNPNVSVVIPTYNGARFIREALESVFRQTLPPREIIVVDDASDDETPDIVSSMIPGAPVPLRLIQLEVNSGGPARPLNTGMRAASGEYTAVLDQDDVFLPDKLEKQAGLLDSYPHLAFAFSYCGSFTRPGQIMQRPSLVQELNALGRKKGWHYEIAWKEMLTLLMRDTNFIYGYPGFVFRRRDWERKGGLDESLRIASDYEFLCWLVLQGPAALLPEISYLRRQHGRNLSDRLYWCILEALRVKVRYLLKKRELLCDRVFEQGLKADFLYLAHHWLETKYDSLALECLHLYRRLWGWEKETLRLLEFFSGKFLSERTYRPASYSDFTKPRPIERKVQEGPVLVSVVTIFLNEEKYLREAVESVFTQTFTDWELLLVDDGSTDGSTQIAQEFVQAHPQKVRYLQHEGHRSKGTGPSRNLGVAHSRGRLIAFLDADDLWFPEKLEKQVSLLEQYPEAGLLVTPALFWHEDGRKELQPMALPAGLIPPGAWLPKILESDNNTACPSMVLMRKDLAVQVGNFEDSFRTLYEDQALWCKVNLNAPVYYHPECLGVYRIHPASVCQSASLRQKRLACLRFNRWLAAFLLKPPHPRLPGLRKSLTVMAQAKLYDAILNSENGHFEVGINGGASGRLYRLRRHMKRVWAYGFPLGYIFSGMLLLDAMSRRLASKLTKKIFFLSQTAYHEGFSEALGEAVKSLPRYALRKVKLLAK